MPGPLLNRDVTVRQGAYLPHWTSNAATYHIVFRLADSLPAEIVERYRRERDALTAKQLANPSSVSPEAPTDLFSKRIDAYLDSGRGACWLAQPKIAGITAGGIRHFDGERYDIFAWCVMPNHVHVVVKPLTHSLSSILHSWKSYTATTANAALERTGEFWQKESYDHIVRDADDLERAIRYVVENPMKAGLVDWRWAWRRPL